MTQRNSKKRPIALLARYELIVLLAVAPLMLFPTGASVVALIVVGLIWLARRHTYGYFTRHSAMNLPELLLLVMALIGFFVSIDSQLSEPKLWGIFLQTILFFSVLNGLHERGDVQWLAVGIVLLTAVTIVLSLVGTDWATVRLIDLPQLYDRLPQLLQGVPDSGLSPGQELFSPREVGATIGMLLPFVTVVAVGGRSRWLRLLAALTLLAGALMLLLSQAIMGLFGLLVGWAIIAVWWKRWLVAPMLLAGVVLAFLIARAAPLRFASQLLSYDNPIGIGVVLRLDIWSRALAMIADMPYTGVGLNTFPLIQTHFYTGFAIGPEPHAHNLLLQTAVDLGLPGLFAFLWLLVAFYITAWSTVRKQADRQWSLLVIGAVASVTAYIAGGVIDVVTLGAKPVAAVSVFVGLVGALHWLSRGLEQPLAAPAAEGRRWQMMDLGVIVLLIALLAASIPLRPGAVASNKALVAAHKSLFTARRLGLLPKNDSEVAGGWLAQAIEMDPTNAQLYGVQGSLLAWEEDPPAALEALARRVELDGQNPLGYAPFLSWQRRIAGQPPEEEWHTLLRIYRQWESRFPDRAENHVLVSLVLEQHLQDASQALAVQDAALAGRTGPRSLLEFYRETLVERETDAAVSPAP